VKTDAVFIAKRQYESKSSRSVHAALGEQLGTLRANALNHLHGDGVTGHKHLFISLPNTMSRSGDNLAAGDAYYLHEGSAGLGTGEESVSSLKLTGSEKRALVLWVLAGIAGVFFAQRYFFRASPKLLWIQSLASRSDAARKLSRRLGENVDGYRSAIEFSVEELGESLPRARTRTATANHLATSQINLGMDVRFYLRSAGLNTRSASANPAKS